MHAFCFLQVQAFKDACKDAAFNSKFVTYQVLQHTHWETAIYGNKAWPRRCAVRARANV